MTVPVLAMSVDDDELLLLSPLSGGTPFVLSRENSGLVALSREGSDCGLLGKTPQVTATRMCSRDSLTFPLFPLFSRENSNTGELASKRQTSVEIQFLLNPLPQSDDDAFPNTTTPNHVRVDEHSASSPMESDYEPSCQLRWPSGESESEGSDASHTPPPGTQLLASSAAGDPRPRPRQQPKPASRRGAHVRERPEMQQTARDGAVHWNRKVQEVRATWRRRAADPAFASIFSPQAEAAQGRVKNKQECLLRSLQMAAADGLIVPEPAFTSPDQGFFGWMGFRVVQGRGAAFRALLDALFDGSFRSDNTVKEGFRRARLLPHKWRWDMAWKGDESFMYKVE